MREKVVIYGAGQFGQLVCHYLSESEDFEVAGFCVDTPKQEDFLGLPLVAAKDLEQRFPPQDYRLFLAIGYADNNRTRARIFCDVQDRGYRMITYVHPSVRVWPNMNLGENVFIFEDNTLQPFSQIGDNVIIRCGNHIGHHTKVESHCFIMQHAVISGNVLIQPFCFIGSNATLRDGIRIEEGCTIGPNALIMKSTESGESYVVEPTSSNSRTTDQIKF